MVPSLFTGKWIYTTLKAHFGTMSGIISWFDFLLWKYLLGGAEEAFHEDLRMWRVGEAAGFGVQYRMRRPALTWLNMQNEGKVNLPKWWRYKKQPKWWRGIKNYYRKYGFFFNSCFLGHKSGTSWGCSLKHENMSFWYFWYLQYHQAGERFSHRILIYCQILVVSPLTSPLPGLLVRLLYLLCRQDAARWHLLLPCAPELKYFWLRLIFWMLYVSHWQRLNFFPLPFFSSLQ